MIRVKDGPAVMLGYSGHDLIYFGLLVAPLQPDLNSRNTDSSLPSDASSVTLEESSVCRRSFS